MEQKQLVSIVLQRLDTKQTNKQKIKPKHKKNLGFSRSHKKGSEQPELDKDFPAHCREVRLGDF